LLSFLTKVGWLRPLTPASSFYDEALSATAVIRASFDAEAKTDCFRFSCLFLHNRNNQNHQKHNYQQTN
jgi:hypothetical protein